MLRSDLALNGGNLALLPATAITTAVSDEVTTPVIIAGIEHLVAQCAFTYGSGGTSADFYVQTSFDGGTTWTDVAAFKFPGVAGRLARDFDGTNDYYSLGSDLTGNADSKTGIASAWVRLDGGNGATAAILDSNGNATHFSRHSSNQFRIYGEQVGGAPGLDVRTTPTYTAGVTWYHVLFGWSLSASVCQAYINDASVATTEAVLLNVTLDYTQTAWAIARTVAAGNYFNGAISEFYFAPGQYLDFSIASNRRKFITAAGLPNPDLGADGSTPTGTAPLIYARNGDPSDNLGTGGDFTAVGSPTSVAGPNVVDTRFQAVKSSIAVAADQAIQDGELSANTILDGVLGDRIRVKYSTTGTFADSTSIKIDAVVKG